MHIFMLLKCSNSIKLRVVCTGCWWGSLRERNHWGDPDVDGRIILRGIFRKWEEMERAQDRDRWLTLENTVMNFQVP
jgi:hypothetical protein